MDTQAVVLVADDDPVNRKVAGLLLEILEVGFETVQDGQQAVEAVRKNEYALILMDIMMPDVDGFEASRRIRRLEFGTSKHVPIIACTALDYESIRDRCIHSGIDDYLAKPYSKELLRDKLEFWSSPPRISTAARREFDRQLERSKIEEKVSTEYNALKMFYGRGLPPEIKESTA